MEDQTGSESRDPSLENHKTSFQSSSSSTHQNHERDLSQLSFSPIMEHQYNDHLDYQTDLANPQFINHSKNHSFEYNLSQDCLNNLSIQSPANTKSSTQSSTSSNHRDNGVCSSNVNFARKNSKKYLVCLISCLD